MSGEDRSFNENLDLLIKLFKRLKDKASFDDMPGIDKTFYQNFEYLLSNYENMRDQLSEELLSKFGEPVKGMIASLVEQLKMELGDDIGDLDLDETEEQESDEEHPRYRHPIAQQPLPGILPQAHTPLGELSLLLSSAPLRSSFSHCSLLTQNSNSRAFTGPNRTGCADR